MYEKAKFRLMLIAATSLLAAGCAPTYAPHLDAPPASSSEQFQAARPTIALAPLDPPPQLPDAEQAPCPPGSGLAACFTREQEAVRQLRFKILHDDRDYCRDAYDRAVKRVSQ
ncbi:MAG TPA: hypothetical protein VJX68_02245 [Candidatus Binatus sp.]|uniref:hypothetical protein n=1 Tax=Candidatus Binatus sp. TaxID=2811406 RepID=UPI002B4739C7|nr:hypothetical protein [Candidatus Binatus sp.]HKN11989.1 hypothetical protein [Candidatus Binatus sp.]